LYVGTLFLLGFFISNLYFFISPALFLNQILGVTILFTTSPIELYFQTPPPAFWEGGTYGSLFYWFGSGIAFFSLLVASLKANPKIGLLSVVSFIFMTVFMSTQPFHNWYWFPVIGILTIPFAHITHLCIKTKVALISLTLIILGFNLYNSMSFIKQEINHKELNVVNFSDILFVKKCLNNEVKNNIIRNYYDMTSIGYSLPLKKLQDRVNYHDSFVKITSPDFKMNKGDLYSFGKRAKGYPAIAFIINDAKNENYIHGECSDVTWIYVQ
ncbi:hypothetical protein QVN83_18405, partial [Yersinia frederiksenii]|uniref:hypothetical protein n=1 Tax=Yersinia frederiksenii TaxID=29484 RepID=UPI0025AB50E4